MERFVLRTYGRMELAQMYSSTLCPMTAYRKLTRWIELRQRLEACGTSSRSRTYTPAQVRLIVTALGEP